MYFTSDFDVDASMFIATSEKIKEPQPNEEAEFGRGLPFLFKEHLLDFLAILVHRLRQ